MVVENGVIDMEKVNELLNELNLNNHLALSDIPEIDLYMDQVIQLFENRFASSKRNDEEKILTKTMINNYAKGKLFFPIHNKKYSKDHLILISLIYQLKGTLSINDIKVTLDKLNHKIVDETFDMDQFYESYLHITDNNIARITEHAEECADEVKSEIAELGDTDSTYLDKVLLLSSFANMSNFYRRAAEKIVDELSEEYNSTKVIKKEGK